MYFKGLRHHEIDKAIKNYDEDYQTQGDFRIDQMIAGARDGMVMSGLAVVAGIANGQIPPDPTIIGILLGSTALVGAVLRAVAFFRGERIDHNKKVLEYALLGLEELDKLERVAFGMSRSGYPGTGEIKADSDTEEITKQILAAYENTVRGDKDNVDEHLLNYLDMSNNYTL